MNRREFIGVTACLPFLSTNLLASQSDDIFVSEDDWKTLLSSYKKLTDVQKSVGSGNFTFISFDKALNVAKKQSTIQPFSKKELDFMEGIFYDNPNKYGFYGSKTLDNITHEIDKNEVIKVPKTGQFLFKGKPFDDYNRILKDVSGDIILTSGIRNVPKQMHLYFNKILSVRGNISEASKVIAPPAYTYHAVHDFDVGKKGLGSANFTELFAQTEEFSKLAKLNYVDIRYVVNNRDGVIYEPWHVKVG